MPPVHWPAKQNKHAVGAFPLTTHSHAGQPFRCCVTTPRLIPRRLLRGGKPMRRHGDESACCCQRGGWLGVSLLLFTHVSRIHNNRAEDTDTQRMRHIKSLNACVTPCAPLSLASHSPLVFWPSHHAGNVMKRFDSCNSREPCSGLSR